MTTLPTDVADGSAGHLAHHNSIHSTLNTLGTPGDVRDVVLASDVSAADATTWVPVPTLSVTNAASGQVWICSFVVVYRASTTGGISIRLRTGAPALTTASHVAVGRWLGLITTATGNGSGLLQSVVRYPAGGTATFGGHGGAGTTTDSTVVGDFRVAVNGSGLTGQTLALDFQQRVLDGANPTVVVAGSWATFSRAV